MLRIGDFIDELRNSDDYIVHIYTQGGCYKLHLLLSKLYPGSQAYISSHKNHIITKKGKKFYDIFGEVQNPDGYTPLTEEERTVAEKWSFYRNNLLLIKECPHCEEPLVFNGYNKHEDE
jgi:hypothetical protein